MSLTPEEKGDTRVTEKVEVKEPEGWTKHKYVKMFKDVPITTFLSVAAFFIFRQFVFDGIETFWWRDVLSAAVGGLVLTGYDYAIKSDNKPDKTATTIFIIILLISTLVYDYTGDRRVANKDVDTETVNTKTEILPFGTTAYELKADESTPWLAFPNGIISNYTVKSPNYDYDLVFSDGTRYKGGDKTVIPKKKGCYMKIIAKSDQIVTIEIS